MTKDTFNIERVQHNLKALTELKMNHPNPDLLKQYSGWGGLRSAIFTPEIYRVLKNNLSNEAISTLKKTVNNAYYTPRELIQFIYDALSLLNKPFKTILEPSAGHGAFFELMPPSLMEEQPYAVELDEVSCRLIQRLYPQVALYHGGFETYHPQKTFDLIIGNPPYGQDIIVDERHTDLSALRIHHYFVAKCMRILAPGGILAMVLPRYFLDNRKNHAREIIHQEGGSLLAAYRLPDNLFADAKVTVDVVFLIKEKGATDWLYSDKIRVGNEMSHLNRYFSLNPSHVLGQLDIVEVYGRPELTCKTSKKGDTISLLRQQLAYFPLQKLPTFEECNSSLAQRIISIDQEIKVLLGRKKQLMNAQRDLQCLERQFLLHCSRKMSIEGNLSKLC